MKNIIIISTFWIAFTMNAKAQWQQSNGPYGGSVSSLAISGTNVFLGTGWGEPFYPPIMVHHGQR